MGLRMPAGSRLQKKHNVQLALTALERCGLSLHGLQERGMRGDITSDDIVSGHREKTLALLWRIIANWRGKSPPNPEIDTKSQNRASHS